MYVRNKLKKRNINYNISKGCTNFIEFFKTIRTIKLYKLNYTKLYKLNYTKLYKLYK